MSISSSTAPEVWRRGEYFISTDASLVDVDVVHSFLSNESYWSRGVSRDIVARSIEHSLAFGLYRETAERRVQVGFARAITDLATIAYLADVFVLPEHRGAGLGVWLIECIRAHPALQRLRIWRLATADAQGLYEKFGFKPLAHPERMMEIVDAAVYSGVQPDVVSGQAVEGER
jgi:ribosomal protein S18 acetylase RimI-like enzyme